MRHKRNRRTNKKNIRYDNILKLVLSIFLIILIIVLINNSSNKNKDTKLSKNHSGLIDVNISDDIDENILADNNSVEDNSTLKNNVDTNSVEQNNVDENIVDTNSVSQNETNANTESPVLQDDINFSMAVTGDIMCHNTVYQDAYDVGKREYNFSYIFEDIRRHLQTADIAVGNLETTFAGSKAGYSGYPNFNTPEVLAKNLKKAGFDVVSTANNHCMDKGYKGIESTIKYLDEADLSHTGTFTSREAQKDILIKNVKGVNIAFLSFTYGTNGIPVPQDKRYAVNLIDKDLIKKQLKLAKKQNPDLICVCMHWGIEYQTKPNQTQKDLADFLFKNGADIILGNHPHVPQNMEKRKITLEDGTKKDGFVIYSLGNFMANQNYKYTSDSAILKLEITKHKENGKITIDSATYTPTYIYKDSSKSSKKFKILDIANSIMAYEADADTSIGKTTYNTLKQELENITTIIGKEIH